MAPCWRTRSEFDVNKDFAHIGMIVVSAVLFVAASPKLGISTFPEFVALAKSKPGQIAVGTNGAGTLPHFAGLVLEKKGNVPITVVPYNQGGTMAAVSDIMGGRVHATIEGVFGLRGPLQSGDLKLIGQMALTPEPEFPNVPTVAETIPGISAIGFMNLAAPAATPEPILRRLAEGLREALEFVEGQAALRRFGDPHSQHDAGSDEGFHRERAEGLVAAGQRIQSAIAKVRPMPTLADMLKNPNAYRGACGDLCAGALQLSPQELADLTLQVAGQSPQRARQIVAEHLRTRQRPERKRRPSRRHLRQHRRSHRRHRSRLHMCNICRRPRS